MIDEDEGWGARGGTGWCKDLIVSNFTFKYKVFHREKTLKKLPFPRDRSGSLENGYSVGFRDR